MSPSSFMELLLLITTCLLTSPSTFTHAHSPSSSSSSSSLSKTTLTDSNGGDGLQCLHGGIRVARPLAISSTASKVEYECACVDGWSGATCQYRDFCSTDSPCQHGRCLNTLDGVLCRCEPGWIGLDCSIEDTCNAETCSLPNGRCVITEMEQPIPTTLSAHPTARKSDGRGQHKPSNAKPTKGPYNDLNSTSSSPSSTASKIPRIVGGVISSECVCELGFTGPSCLDSQADECAAIQPCDLFHLDANSTGGSSISCGCRLALESHCHWCLELGQAFAPGISTPIGDACSAVAAIPQHCPSPAAQVIKQCQVMDGTSYGWCQAPPKSPPAATTTAASSTSFSSSSKSPPAITIPEVVHGYAVEGNPSAPVVGARRCHHWVWNAAGCKADWTTGTLALQPTQEECSMVPPCYDAITASSSLCGCQAAMSIGCEWCLEQQLAFPPSPNNHSSSHSTPSSNTCRRIARHPSHCPSQQAQTIHECAAVGGLPFGWCALDDAEPKLGYSMDGTAHSPATNPHQCKAWYFHSTSCPSDSTLISNRLMASSEAPPEVDSWPMPHQQSSKHHPDFIFTSLILLALLGCVLAYSNVCLSLKQRFQALRQNEYEEIRLPSNWQPETTM